MSAPTQADLKTLLPGATEVDARTTLLSQEEFTAWLSERVRERSPAAAVRFGDAEAQLLDADPDEEESMATILKALRRETGLSFAVADVLELQALVASAFAEADVLGIRFNPRFLSEQQAWLRKLVARYEEQVVAGRRPVALASCLLGHDSVEALPGLLAGRRVSAVSCRDLAPVLEDEWGAREVVVYQMPSQAAVRDVDGEFEAAMHGVPIWPDAHSRVREELTVRERGEVFLVGAGLFAKDLCILIRERGGIAVDMGSALDPIAGKVTRGPKRRVLELHMKGVSDADVAARLQRLYDLDMDPEEGIEAVRKILAEIRQA